MAQKILLIDDDADDRSFFCEAIEDIDPEVICYLAADGRKALTKLNNAEIELPDIIFLDINMPIMNGWDCLKKLKEHEAYNKVPVIMYSTSSNQLDIDKANSLGALGLFTKPPDFKELKTSLEVIVENLKNNSLPSLRDNFVPSSK